MLNLFTPLLVVFQLIVYLFSSFFSMSSHFISNIFYAISFSLPMVWCFSIGRVNPQLYFLAAGGLLSEVAETKSANEIKGHQNHSGVLRWMQHYVNVLCINAWQVTGLNFTLLHWLFRFYSFFFSSYDVGLKMWRFVETGPEFSPNVKRQTWVIWDLDTILRRNLKLELWKLGAVLIGIKRHTMSLMKCNVSNFMLLLVCGWGEMILSEMHSGGQS